MPGPFNQHVGLALTLGAAGALTHYRHDVKNDAPHLTALRALGYFALCGAGATYIRWLFMRPPQRTPTPKEVAKAIAAGAPIAPIDPRMLLSAQQMSQDLRAGKYTSVELVDLFIAHIERVDRRAVNAVVWRRFDEARAEARHADEILAEARSGARDWATVGWLTGVPCSMKESFSVKGCSNCCGHPRRNPTKLKQYGAAIAASGHPPGICETDAANVARLKAAGAIILGLTNTSELAMWVESNNLVYGTTCNPYDATRLVGGSSGGEAAAVAAIYAPFGNGSDIGGSIRMPAMFCGTFGHKPSTRLVPNAGMFPGTATYGNFIVGTGTLARHVEDIWPVMKTLSEGGFLEDPELYPHCPSLETQMVRQREYQKSLGGADANVKLECPGDIPPSTLSVYLIEQLPILAALPCSSEQRRAARVAAETLAANTGCKLHKVDFSRPDTVPEGWAQMKFALKMWAAVMRRDSVAFVDLVRGGYGKEEVSNVYWEWVKWFFARSEHTFPVVTLCVLEDIEKRFIPEKDTDADVDAGKLLARQIADTLGPRGALIVPAFPCVAATHSAPKLLIPSFSYTCLFNSLQLPTTSVPVWLSPDSEKQRLPCGVQVIGGWGNDVAPMAVASALAKHTPYCYTKVPQWMTPVAEAAVVAAAPAKDATAVQM